MPSRPNILWITTDHQRTDALGCYGSAWGHSPGGDRLATVGVRCDQAICQSPSCTPSRASMWTSMYVRSLGKQAYGRGDTPTKRVPLIKYFKEAGYQTAHLGKYGYMNNPAALESCFDICEYGPAPGGALTPWCVNLPPGTDDKQFIRTEGTGIVVGGTNPLPPDQTICAIMTQKAQTFFAEQKRSPFFLRLSIDVPHPPFVPLPQFIGSTDRDRIDLPMPSQAEFDTKPKREGRLRAFYGYDKLTPPQLRESRGCYYDLCNELDAAIDQVLSALEREGLRDNTIVVLNTDHGSTVGEHGLGTIRSFYEPVVRVPLIWSWPGHLPQDTVLSDPVELIDILPTLLDLAGLDVPEGIDGRSIVSQLQGQTSDPDRATFCEFDTSIAPIGDADWIPKEAWWKPEHDCRVMVRQGGWKLECNYNDESEYGEDGALYDLTTDPQELTNLFNDAAYQSQVDRLKRITQEWLESR